MFAESNEGETQQELLDSHVCGRRDHRLVARREDGQVDLRKGSAPQITGHGASLFHSVRAWDAAGAFFDLPHDDRMTVAMPDTGYPCGCQPHEGERLASSLGSCTDRFCDAMHAYYRRMGDLSARVMSLMAAALGLPGDYFEPFISAHTSTLRLIDYPHSTVPPLAGQLRAGAHTDDVALTILRQEHSAGGLEVMSADGRWVGVASVDDAFVVNVRRLLGPLDERPVAFHAPRRDQSATRRWGVDSSPLLAFFHTVNWDAEIACITTCLSLGRQRNTPLRAGRHLMAKFVSAVT